MVPVMDGPPQIRRSTRKAAEKGRELVASLMQDENAPGDLQSPGSSRPMDDDTVDGDYMGEEHHAAPNPMLASITPPSITPRQHMSIEEMFSRTTGARANPAEEEILRNPSRGGRNLCRVESIDCMFDRDSTPTHTSTALDRTDSSRLVLSQCQSEGAFGQAPVGEAPPQMQRVNSSLALSRCMSSTFSLGSVGEDYLMSTVSGESDEDHSSGMSSGESGLSAPNPMLVVNA